MQNHLMALFMLFLSACSLETQVNWAKRSIVEKRDIFKNTLTLCTKEYVQVSVDYSDNFNVHSLCYYKNEKNRKMYVIVGTYGLGSPVPISFNEALDIKGTKLKITSEDDRRLGMTKNAFYIVFDDGYFSHIDSALVIKLYGKNVNHIIGVPFIDILALKEKVKEMDGAFMN